MCKVLTIVVPAYNEEEAIAGTLTRCMEARPRIVQEAGLEDVEVILVNDGSRDRTVEESQKVPGVRRIDHPVNRGYGAALKTGFEAGRGDLVSFLDGDGTCDPLSFIPMVRAIRETGADVVLGNRLGPDSQMPRVRRIGNTLYAVLLSFLGNVSVRDTASGMRVIRRRSLPLLYPLPDGLEFTPAMSARAILDERLSIAEVPMPYEEREGESKLSVIKDGVRFLRVILDAAIVHRPLRVFGTAGLLLWLAAAAYAVYPAGLLLSGGPLPEWLIYRGVFILVAAIAGLNLLSVGIVSQIGVDLIHEVPVERPKGWLRTLFRRVLAGRLAPIASVLFLLGVTLNARTLSQYLTSGKVYVHWGYVVAGGILVLASVQLLCLGVLGRIFALIRTRQEQSR